MNNDNKTKTVREDIKDKLPKEKTEAEKLNELYERLTQDARSSLHVAGRPPSKRVGG